MLIETAVKVEDLLYVPIPDTSSILLEKVDFRAVTLSNSYHEGVNPILSLDIED